jgi:hypothetical protein
VESIGILACETVVELNVTAFDPAKFMKALLERRQTRFDLRVITIGKRYQ